MKKSAFSFVIYQIRCTFAPANKAEVPFTRFRKVAQLVAHYVRDVGVGRSSRLFPTKKDDDKLNTTCHHLFSDSMWN